MIYQLGDKRPTLLGKGHFIAPGAAVIGDVVNLSARLMVAAGKLSKSTKSEVDILCDHDTWKVARTHIRFRAMTPIRVKGKSNKILINPPQGAFYLMPEFINKKHKNSSKLCDAILDETGVALLPGSDFGFKPNKMLARLSYTDFDGTKFLENISKDCIIDNDIIEKYAPNVVNGIEKLSIWAKKL